MLNKTEIIEYYCRLCLSNSKLLSRTEYRNLGPKFSSTTIERMWGNWGNFLADVNIFSLTKENIPEPIHWSHDKCDKKRAIVSSVFVGEEYDENAFTLLKGMAKSMDADLFLLTVCTNKKKTFTSDQLDELGSYLTKEVTFKLDDHCICKGIDFRPSNKRPLTNVEKISENYNLILISSAKQHCKILPYDTNETFKIACSTGTISNFEYKHTIPNYVDMRFNKCGAVVLEYDETKKRFLPRNIEVVDNKIYDGDRVYVLEKDKVKCEKTTVDALILGDLHLPEEDSFAIKQSLEHINRFKPQNVMIGDWCSFNSINHHDANKYLNKTLYCQQSLEDEIKESVMKLNHYVEQTKDCKFYIIHSNHDEFLDKWLNSGEIEKDKQNVVTGMKFYLARIEHKNPFHDYGIDKRVTFLKKGELFEINGVNLSNHGDTGVAGMKGNSTTYVKTYNKSVTGHTHSPKIEDSNYTVGTCSKLNLNYTSHLSNWAFANAIVHKNGTVQLIF